MRLLPRWFLGLTTPVLPTSGAGSQGPSVVTRDATLRTFLQRFEEGTRRFINGDAALWKENASHGNDATVVGGWGAYEKGWDEVGPRYDWAAARFKDSDAKLTVEYLSSGVSGDLAYTVAIERSEVCLMDQPAVTPMALRVTHVFRREEGGWKLLHRHADPLIGKTAAASVLQR